jgi:hypothetical protein
MALSRSFAELSGLFVTSNTLDTVIGRGGIDSIWFSIEIGFESFIDTVRDVEIYQRPSGGVFVM